MASTLTNDGALTYASFPIEKTETTADGDIMVYGKASDGSVDHDQQIVDPKWMARAVKEWFASGPNLRVQHNSQRDPAGVGLDWNSDDSGGTWVKSLVIEPIAQKLVSKGALRAYSVGIARPTIERDVTGKARGGIITDGTLCEISLVDRPANKSCGIQLVKSAGDGSMEYVGKVFGDSDVIAKFTGINPGGIVKEADGTDSVPFHVEDMSLTFTPGDLAKILKSKIIEQHYDDLAVKALYDAEAEVYKRDVNTAERRSLASAGHALPDGSYPIANAGDLGNAAHLAATGHGNAEGAKKLIARRAKELGVANPLDSDESKTERGSVVDATPELIKTDTAKEAEPQVTKDPEDKVDNEESAEPGNKAAKPKKGKKGKMPPWMTDDKDDSKGDDDSCKMDHAHSEKCMPSGTPQSASGAKDAAPMQEIPNTGPAPESPMPAGRKTPDTKSIDPEHAAMLRFKSIGIDSDLGRLHDMSCPAYDPDDVAKYHPYADFSNLIDDDLWMRKALDAATGPMPYAMEMTEVWQAVQTLKSADMAELNDYRLEAHKAFRDANPGVSSYPSPGAMSPSKFNRGVISGGHAANSPGYDGPNTSPAVATSPPSVGSFNRPPLSSGHQSPSPAFMKHDGEYPSQTGVPMVLDYAHIEKDKARRALAMMHDHLSHQFPQSCPLIEQDAYRQPAARPVPPVEGLGKTVEPAETAAAVSKSPEIPADVLSSIEKGMRKKLGKKVLAGKCTVDEARAKMGRMRAQKVAEWGVEQQFTKGEITREEALKALGIEEIPEPVTKGATFTPNPDVSPDVAADIQKSLNASSMVNAEVIKSAIAEAIAPLVTKVEQQQEIIAKQEARWEATADLADPKTAGWMGLALNPVQKSARPAGVTQIAENAERTQVNKARQMYHTWRASENPFEREAARAELDKMGFTD